MKHIAKLAAVFFYIFILSFLLGFKLGELFDIKQLFLVILGMVILFLPGYRHGEIARAYVNQMAKCALFASYIQTFILLFLAFSTETAKEAPMQEIAKNCRPLLYGICLWVILSKDNPAAESASADALSTDSTFTDSTFTDRNELQKNPVTATEIYDAYRRMGLTNREAELALQIERGLTNGEIAAELNISETTVKKHISNIFEKLDIQKRAQIKEKRKSS